MKTPDKSDYKEPGTEFGRRWNEARQYAQTRDEIRNIIEQYKRNESKSRRIWLLSIAASVIICAGLIGVFKPFRVWDSKPDVVRDKNAEQVIGVPVFPPKTPDAKASVDTFRMHDGSILLWHPDSIPPYKFDFQLKLPGVSGK